MSTIAAQPRITGSVAPVRVQGVAGRRPVSVAARGQMPTVRTVARDVSSGAAGEGPVQRAGRPSGRVASSGGRLRLTRRGRFVVVLLGLLVVVAGVMGGRAVAGAPEQATEVRTYAVQPGDTLWSLAQSLAQPDEDVRDVVLQLQRLNDLSDGSVVAGEVLMLPVTE